MSMASFLAGFLDEKADQITSRKAKGEKYFEEQMERARRISSTQLEARRERYRQLAQTGNTLINTANMPEHILRGLVSAGPEAVNTAFELYQQVPTHEWSADDWENIYTTSEFYAQEFDEDLPTFMRRTVGLLGENYRATEQTGGDLQSAFTASALGYNAKDKARSRLSEVQVSPGFSASDLLEMESRPGWQSDIDTTYSGPNVRAISGILPSESLSTQEQLRGWSTYNDMLDQAKEQIAREFDTVPSDPSIQREAQQRAFSQFVAVIGPQEASRYNFIQSMLNEAEASEQPPEAPVDLQAGVGPETPLPAVSEPPVAPQGITETTGVEDGRFPAQDSPLIPQPSFDPSQIERQPNLFQRGAARMRDTLSGLFGGEGRIESPQSRPRRSAREQVDSGIPRGWSLGEGGNLQTDQGRLVQPMGVDTSGNWIYKDIQTGEEIKSPN